MAEEKILPKGFRTFEPHQNAPDFVKGQLVISLNDFIKFCETSPELLSEYNGAKQLKLDILESRKGGLYFAVNTFKPEKKIELTNQPFQTKEGEKPFEEKLPF